MRPRFDTLVEKVHAELGQLVHKGDPLVDLHSTDLAAAKNDVQTKYVQWQHDLRVLKLDEKLLVQEAVSQQKLVDDQNAENKSRLDYVTAREQAADPGCSRSRHRPLDPATSATNPTPRAALGNVADKAKMTCGRASTAS